MARKTYKARAKRPYADSLSDAAISKMARQIVDAHASDGIEGMDDNELARHIWNIALKLPPFEHWVLVMHVFREHSFRELAKREHLKKKDVERIFNEVCAKLKRMFERFGTQSL